MLLTLSRACSVPFWTIPDRRQISRLMKTRTFAPTFARRSRLFLQTILSCSLSGFLLSLVLLKNILRHGMFNKPCFRAQDVTEMEISRPRQQKYKLVRRLNHAKQHENAPKTQVKQSQEYKPNRKQNPKTQTDPSLNHTKNS